MACRTCNLPAPGLPSLVSDFHLNAGPRPVELLFMVLSGIGRGTAFSRRRPRLSSDDLDAFGANFCLTILFCSVRLLFCSKRRSRQPRLPRRQSDNLESPKKKNRRRQGSGIYVACTFWLLCRLIIFRRAAVAACLVDGWETGDPKHVLVT